MNRCVLWSSLARARACVYVIVCVCVCVCTYVRTTCMCVCTYYVCVYVYVRTYYVCVCVRVIHCRGRLLVTQPAYTLQNSDRSSGRAETTSHTTHRDSEATTPRLASRTYLLLGEQACRAWDSNPALLVVSRAC